MDGVLCILDDLGPGQVLVGDVGIGEDGSIQELLQAARVVGHGPFQELKEVDDLVVTPIPDGGPRIVRFRALPIDAVGLVDDIGVVPVNGGGVHKLGQHGLNVGGVAHCEGLPVLEDVPPVPLVVELSLAVFIFQDNGELVPGAGGVPVPATEGDRDVLHAEPGQVVIILGQSPLHEDCVVHNVIKTTEPLVSQCSADGVPVGEVGCHIGLFNTVPVVEDPTPHAVEHHVGKVVHDRHVVPGALQCVTGPHDLLQINSGLCNIYVHLLDKVLMFVGLQQLLQLCHRLVGLANFRHHHPCLFSFCPK
mmetsp:Transcript_34208/g.61341  ORF Transcript_34208/g.61341 Transcript_34208/m.61341 type:complete len:306 (-) Transcript_34208:1217-2134(-)